MADDDVDPAVSVILPVYNDPTGLTTTIESALGQSNSPPYEILIVDNGSTDTTPSVAKEYEQGNAHVSLLSESEIQSSYAARNVGIQKSRGDILAFVDADMRVTENWLTDLVSTIEKENATYLGCSVELTLPEQPSLAARYDYHTGFPVKEYLLNQLFAPTCCLAVRRTIFNEIGHFDHRLVSGGDKEFGHRAHDAGIELHFAENITMYHPTRNSIRALRKKDFRVGRGLCQLQMYYPERYGRPGIPPRPSGVRSPEQNIPRVDYVAFSLLSMALTVVRGAGYYYEWIHGSSSQAEHTVGVDQT